MIQNRYLVVHLIGKGGMGEVYLAVDQRLGSAVALKRTSFADDQMLAAAFEREAKILARLRHPVLPKVSDHFSENGEQYLVMEHISGDDLAKRLETAQKPFPVSWVMFWADQLLDALSYLHSHEPPIIHRDIKPQNLKLTDENHIILLDFGLSKDTSNKSVVSKPGTSGSVVGYTPHFAPMEQIRGTGTSPRSDIYALSATLYQLMTNVVPDDALSRADSMLNGDGDPIRSLSDINPEISPAVSNVILKGLEVSQDKRFATASDMQKALRQAYTQMQNQMSANTVAFNAADHAGADVHLTSPPIDTHAAIAPSEMATITPSIPKVAIEPGPLVTAQIIDDAVAFDATLQMDAVHVDAVPVQNAVRQADVKTEVFLASDLPLSKYVPDPPKTDEPVAPVTDDYGYDVASPVPDSPQTDGSGPAATVPLFTLGDARMAKAGEPPAPEFFNTIAVAATPPPTPAVISQQPKQKPPTPKKKSKAGLILGGLAGLFVLALIAGGAAWFVYNNYVKGEAVKPTPTRTPTIETSPSPLPSPSETPEATPTANTNANINAGNVDVTVSPTPTTTTTTTPSSTPVSTKSTPQVAPTRAATPVSRPPATPRVKPTPKIKPNNDRTVIDQ